MINHWTTYKLGEIIDDIAMGPFGSNIKVDNFVPSGVPVIRGTNLNKGGFEREDQFAFITEEKAASLKRSLAYPDDLVITHRGTLGQVGIIPFGKYPKYLVSQSQLKLTVNREYLVPKYLYYFFKTEKGQYELLKNRSQVGVPAIATPTKALKEIVIDLPSIEEQNKIVSILSSLDDKIELNKKINQTLESIAQAIFKEWFVDFRFPGNTNEVEYDLPKGWHLGNLEELVEVEIGGDWGEEYEFVGSVPVICLRGTDLDNLRQNGYSEQAPLRYVKDSSIKKRKLSDKDILLGGSGLGPIGKSLLCHNNLHSLYHYEIIYSNFCKRLTASSKEIAAFVQYVLEKNYLSGELSRFFIGTSIPNLDVKNLLKSKLVIPTENTINYFYPFLDQFYSKLFNKENIYLQRIRDSLLPKLITGQIKV